jgi:hypothetical protein
MAEDRDWYYDNLSPERTVTRANGTRATLSNAIARVMQQ